MITKTLDLSAAFDANFQVQADLCLYNDSFELVKAYKNDGQGVLVKLPELEEEALKIRYDAYCTEHDFEPSNALGVESDEYDDRALMALVRHKPSNNFVATVRFIPSTHQDFDFPTAKACDQVYSQFDVGDVNYTEISRLCISYARMHDADMSRDEGRMVFPALLAASFGVSRDLKASHWLGCMEAKLINKLNRFYNVSLDWVGETFEHHGKRNPFLTKWDTIDRSVHGRHTILRDIMDFECARELTWNPALPSFNLVPA